MFISARISLLLKLKITSVFIIFCIWWLSETEEVYILEKEHKLIFIKVF
jgi:hypothetical protein